LSRTLRARLTALAVAALAFVVVTLVSRTLPLSNIVALIVAVGSPYVPLVALVGMALAALCRRILLLIVTGLMVAVTLAVQVPWYYSGHPADVGQHIDVRVLSSNLRKGQAEASSFVGLAKASADVITVSELTPEAVRRFSTAGINEVFPYSVLIPAPDARGIGLWSRYPLSQPKLQNAPATAKLRNATVAAARLQVPGVRFDPLLASVHVTSPVAAANPRSFDRWRLGTAATKARLAAYAEAAGPAAVIIAGDFNSTPDMWQFRDLLTNGYRDGAEQTGAGFAPTFPSNTRYPPLLTIDHVLTRQAAVSSIRTVDIPGSDHRALLATIEVPLDPTAS
jgi:endonuclease/exonuclease/phosphatase (EEP) superfamily protein YafD